MRAVAAKLLFASAALLMAGMCVALLLQIGAREFRLSVDWTEELSRFAFISMVFLAAAYATLTRRHLEVTVFSDLIARRIGRAPVAAFHGLVLTAFDATMAWYSGLNFVEGLRWPNISPALGFNQNHLFLFMCAGFAASALINLDDLIAALRGRPRAREGAGGA